jgi:hypothetical protein
MQKLNALFHIKDPIFDAPKEHLSSFTDRNIRPAYAYQSKLEAPSTVQHDTPLPHIHED